MAGLAFETTTSHCKKIMMKGFSVFCRGFNSSKCKTKAKMAKARIKLLRNKREVIVRQMRRDVALLLQSRQDATARIRVEHVIREQNIMAANEIIELFCELIVSRVSIISKQRECPSDLKEGISSLIFAAPRCADIPELQAIRSVFEKKYGKDFVSAATDLRPSCGVNRTLIEKLSVKSPGGEVKLKLMKEIAKEYQIEWDTTETEMVLLKPPEEPIEGPHTFVSAASMPVKPVLVEQPNKLSARSPGAGGDDAMQYDNATWAAEAAAESAKKAIAAAQAAAYLANKNFNQNGPRLYSQNMDHQSETPWRTSESQKFGGSYHLNNETHSTLMDGGKMHRRHTFNAPNTHADIKFDESDCDEEIEMERPRGEVYPPPTRRPPAVPPSHDHLPDRNSTDYMGGSHKPNLIAGVHPKLPDYDSLAACFEALKHRNSLP